MKIVLDKIIDPGQFCCVPRRSIVQCNMLIRDIMYYINNENKGAAFLQLDWYKAFDLVNIEFLIKVLHKFGFVNTFIMLYNNIESAVSVNNL